MKDTVLNFIGNLTVEQELRQCISQDMAGLLTNIWNQLEDDVRKKPFDWVDSASRALHALCNVSIMPAGQQQLMQRPFDQVCEIIFKTLTVRPDAAEQKELIERILQLLSRLAK